MRLLSKYDIDVYRNSRSYTYAFLGTFLVATLLVVSCSTAKSIDSGGQLHLPALQSYTLYVASDVDADGQIAVAEAVRQWEEFTDVQITVVQGSLGCFDAGCFEVKEVSFADFNAILAYFGGSGDGHYIGYTVPYFVFISTSTMASYDEEQDTVEHEFGHMIGLEHPCTAPCSNYALMNPSYKAGADHVACADVAAYYAERPAVDAGDAPMACTDVAGALDESSDGGPEGDGL